MTTAHQLFRITTIAFSLAVWLNCQSSGMAGLIVFANSTSNMGGDGQPAQATSGTAVDVAGGASGVDFTDAHASASAGQLRAYSEARSAPGSGYFGIFASNSAYFRDDFLFESAGRAGTTGTVQIKFTVDGTLAVARNSSQGYVSGIDSTVRANADYTFKGGTNGPAFSKSESLRTDAYATAQGVAAHTGSPFLGIEQTYTIPFTFGTVLEGVELRINSNAQAIGRPDFSSSAVADLSHTANWGGFGELRDASGTLLTDYTFTSGSGFDFTQSITAVPEPSSMILGMIGCSAIALRRRFRSLSSVKSALTKN